MDRRKGKFILLAFLGSAALFVTLLYSVRSSIKSPDDYNVVLITINVLRADHVSAYGYDRKTTPALDDLAQESYLFKNAFTQVGYTFPSMMSILTSIYPASHRVYFAFKDKLPQSIKTLPELFKLLDYTTAWFAPLEEPHLALDAGYGRGFDSVHNVDIELNGAEFIPQWIEEQSDQRFFLAMNFRHTHGPYFPKDMYRSVFKSGKKGKLIENMRELESKVFDIMTAEVEVEGSITSQMFTRETVRNNKEYFSGAYTPRKFAKLEELILPDQHHKIGHLMMKIYDESVNKYSKENMEYFISLYDACILGTDQEIIRPVIKALKESGLYDKTMIIVTGDHGESLGEHGIIGHGAAYYDEFIHVPLVIKMPYQKEGKELDEIVESIDIFPTILEVVGMKEPFNIHGKSLVPVMSGDQGTYKKKLYAFGQNNDAAYLRSEDWKLVMFLKDIEDTAGDLDALYNLKDDPDELESVKSENFEKYQELRALLKAHVGALPDYTEVAHQFAPNIDKETQERIKKTGYW